MQRRHLFALAVGLVVGALQPAVAQERVIRVIVPYPAGGNADNIARLYSDGLSAKLGQPVIVENKPGAGAVIGAQAAARSPNDGSVLFVAPNAVFVVTPNLKETPYDPHKDFVPIARLTSWIPMMVARKDFPANTLPELVALVKKEPGKYTFASAGPATVTHLMGELMNQKLGMKTVHVPYKGSADFVADLLSGRIDFVYDSVVVPQVKSGQLKAIASMAEVRHPDLPAVPTLKELGVELDTDTWYGVFAPRGTPQAIVDKIGAASREVVAKLDRDKLNGMSMTAAFQGPAEFKAQIMRDDAKMREVIKKADIKIQ
jgi:tripartite-type tricarboxylate transporter receptor subunit TctC